jgi:hypothetical protein
MAKCGLVLSGREETVDREQAINWLRSQGVNASKRDSALGASIFIPVGPPRESSGITGYRNVFYLNPRPEGSWEFLNCVPTGSRVIPILKLAVRAASDTIIGPRSSRM